MLKRPWRIHSTNYLWCTEWSLICCAFRISLLLFTANACARGACDVCLKFALHTHCKYVLQSFVCTMQDVLSRREKRETFELVPFCAFLTDSNDEKQRKWEMATSYHSSFQSNISALFTVWMQIDLSLISVLVLEKLCLGRTAHDHWSLVKV